MHNMNADVFNEIDSWVHKSFDSICSNGRPDTNKATCSYPIVTDVTAKQLYTALVVMSKFLLNSIAISYQFFIVHVRTEYQQPLICRQHGIC